MQKPTSIADSLATPRDAPPLAATPLRRYGVLALLASGPLVLLLLQLVPALNYEIYHNAFGHLLVVGMAALLASGLALRSLQIAIRANDGRVFLIGMGFFAVASIFVIHAAATPDILISGRGLAVAWSAFLSLVCGSFFFMLSGIALSPAANRRLMRYAWLELLLYIGFWVGYSWVVLVWLPSLTPALSPDAAAPAHDHAPEYGVPAVPASPLVAQVTAFWPLLSIIGVLCYLVAAIRHYQFYRRAPSQLGLALTCGIALLGEALVSQRFAASYTISFWLYHVQEFAGFGVISYAVLVAYGRGQSDDHLLEQVFLPGTRARLRETYDQAMRALLATLDRGEHPTPALRQTLREQFHLSESQLEVFEQTAAAVTQERRQRHELEQLNAMLRQLQQDRDELTQMLIHDLRSPLTGMVGFLDLLRREPLSADQREFVERARRSGRNLAGLIDDLLDIGHMEAGHIDLERSRIAVRPLCDECAAEFSAWLQQDAKTISVVVPDDLPLINADVRLLRRVLFNLLSNAIKHTPAHTQITLRATAATDAVVPVLVIAVEDTGDGIAAEYLNQIFEKYGRGKHDQNNRYRSTGLGLTFCRLAIEAHGGTINVASVVGQGTTFRIVLPLAAQS